MLIKNRTIQNRSKQERLNTEHIIPFQNITGGSKIVSFLQTLREINKPKEQILFSIGCYLLNGNKNKAVKKFLSEYNFNIIDIQNIPINEFDLLGSAYQYLNSKKENLEKGSFYTCSDIAKDFVKDLNFIFGQRIFDPSCGSGAFLFSSNAPAEQIFGVDYDPIAIMIAKFNYFIKFPNAESPNLFCDDFFHWYSTHKEEKFDYVIGNPPYGANLDLSKIQSKVVKSGESFSYFLETGYYLLENRGLLRFLLPESILNVKKHVDIRDFMLQQTNLKKIRRYSQKFAGVMSDVYMIELDNNSPRQKYVTFINETSTRVPKKAIRSFQNHIFVQLTEQDINIIEKVSKLKRYDLSNSIFALGVVTGDNKTKLLTEKISGSEHIYTGKEVEKYNLLAPRNYLIFDRENLQQVALDEIYRAPKKLVYKTINKFLKVALDTTKSLTTNSANIIIPKECGMDIYAVMALLNSDLYSYLHVKLFGGVNKIAKENLMALPLPKISKKENLKITNFVKGIIEDQQSDEELQHYINTHIFKLNGDEIKYINHL